MIKLLTYDVYKSGMHRFKELADETYQDKEHLPKYYLRRVASSYVPVGYDEAYRLVYEISGDSETHYAGNDVIGIKGSSGGGIILSYIVPGSTPLSSDWLTDNPGDPAFTPNDTFLYLIVSPGNMYNCIYRFITTSVEEEHVIGSYVKVSESRGDGAILAYEVYGKTPFASDWLSGESLGSPLEPKDGLLYLVISQGKYYNMLFRYDASANSGAGAYTMLSSKGSGIIFVYENSSGTEFGPDWFEDEDHTVITPEEGQVYLDLTPGDFENNMFRFDSSLGQAGQYVSVSGGSGGGGAIMSYIVSDSTALSPGWLSKTAGGEALRPNDGSLYLILSAGQYYSFLYRFDSSIGQDGQYVLVGNSRIVELTETEYINLEQQGLIDNGIIYLITDGAPSAPTGNDFIPVLSVVPQKPYNGQIILWKGAVGGDFTVQNAFYYYESSSAHWFKSNLGIDAQVIQVNSLPLPSAQEIGKVYQYIGTSTNDLVHNYFYECTGSSGDYFWTNVDVQDSNKFQYDTMPVASADWIGKVIQYIGVTGNDYTHNYFYECVEDDGSYLWEVVRVESEETKEMLFDDWDLLPQSEKDNGQAYFIPDVNFKSEIAVKTGFTPVGTVISVMGNTAPKYYLACDGTEYNISDYPELTAYFIEQFNAVNYFGGDGITTFAVPDLRGEFLRGTGTNSHVNQGSGANVGVHQNATAQVKAIIWGGDNKLYIGGVNENTVPFGTDSEYVPITHVGRRVYNPTTTDTFTEDFTHYTSRPTNTSVLYCIAFKDIYIGSKNIDTQVTIPDNTGDVWTEHSDGYFYIDVPVSGIRTMDTPFIDIEPDMADYEIDYNQWKKIIKADTKNGFIRIYASDAFERAVTMSVKTIR